MCDTIVIEKQECCICMDDIQPKNIACTPCGHTFCLTCLLRSFFNANTCPYCRTELVEYPEEDEDSDWGEEESVWSSSQAEEVDEEGWETVSENDEDEETVESNEDDEDEATVESNEEEEEEEVKPAYISPFDTMNMDKLVNYAHHIATEDKIDLTSITTNANIETSGMWMMIMNA